MNKVYQRINWQNEPSISTPLNETNLNKIDYALDVVDGRVVTFDTTKANQSDLLQTVKTVAYNTTTGVFTFTFWNGNTVTADLNIEKIPVSFSMSEQGIITMTTADGTQYTADVASLIKTYSFADSSVIDFTVTTDASGNKTVTADIVDGSITGQKLQPNYLADCEEAVNDAEAAASSASGSATTAGTSAQDSEAWAVGTRGGVPVPSTDPAYENNAKYYAEHGQGSSFSGLSDTNITNPTNGQVPVYNSTTQKWENQNAPSSGLLPHLYIDSEVGSTVTVVAPDSSVITPTQVSSGHWECDVPSYGVYVIHSVLSGDDATLSLTVDDVKEYHVTDTHYSYTLNVYAPSGSTIRVTATGETYTGTGQGSTAVPFALHQPSTTYTVQVTLDGQTKSDSVTTPSTTGQSGSKTIQFGTINITLDADFVGETITCTKDGVTISKIASSTSLTFYPPTTGTWTISGTVSGTTYSVDAEVVDLSTPVSVSLETLQTVTVTLYSATEDTVTFTDASGVQKTEVFASGQSSKSIDITIQPNGQSITFTSSVAKNPDDLSQYYSKALTVTTSTTELYLMPDAVKTLYWWGYQSSDLEPWSSANGWTTTYSGMVVNTAEFQTNYVDLSATSNGVKFVGSKTIEAIGTKLHGIYKGITPVSNSYGSLRINTAKVIGSSGFEQQAWTSANMEHSQITTTMAGYIGAGTSAGRNSQLYALWYE